MPERLLRGSLRGLDKFTIGVYTRVEDPPAPEGCVAGKNERKREILRYLAGRPGGCTSAEVASALGISQTDASTLLRRYHLYGYVTRRRVQEPGGPPKEFVYTIRPVGLAKLRWLEEGESRIKPVLRDDEERIHPKLRD